MKSPFKRIAAFLLLACASMTANAWWSQDWSYRTRINIDTGPNGVPLTQSVDRAAVLVRLHSGNITFADLKADGSDLRFVAGDDRTPLKFHFEKFDPREEVALVWVDVSQLQPGVASSMYAYYGNQQAAPAAAPATTYSSDYALVWHFSGSGQPADVTVNANNALSGPDARELNGLIGQALRLDGTAPVALPASASLRLAEGQPLTLSAWVRPSSVSTGLIWAVPGIVQLGIDNGLAFLDVAGQRVQAATPIAADTWTHVALRADKAAITLLVGGVAMGELPRGLPAIETGSFLGGSPAGPNFTGLVDELQIARKALPVDALQLAVHSQSVGARLLTFDSAEKTEAGGHNYVGVLFDALTLDAWIVIVVLGVMSLISWAVMIGKGLVISRTMSANDDFLDQYKSTIDRRAAHAGLAGPKLGKQTPMSSLARLFQIGQRELAERLAENAENGVAEQGSRHAIAPQSVAAIRSALDAAHAREGQRLNRGMVLLTIAISGGPFLGLLGTVVGVMITFAGVAAAGDVNINAIAPGIAAALLATVAGLAVAIPALFGYNYLLSRVEEISTDHQIFVDELEKRIAETYRVPGGA